MLLLPHPEQGPKCKDNFSPEVIEAFLYTFSRPGALTAAINYYRCMFKMEKKRAIDTAPPPKKIEVPSLVIWVMIMHKL